MHIHLQDTGGKTRQQGVSSAQFGTPQNELGAWARWNWDGTALRAEVDRYGFYPIFYALLDDGCAVSDSISELIQLGARRVFDDAGIAAFLRLGFFLGEDTPFADVRAFPPGGVLTWSREHGLAVSGTPIPRKVDHSISLDAAIDEYVERFRSAIAVSIPSDMNHTAMPLSGGRDSRHIAYEIKRLGIQPGIVLSQMHFKHRSNDDMRIAADVCRILDWPISIVPQSDDPVEAELEKNILFECLTDEHAWFGPAASMLTSAKVTSIYDGLGGDVLSNGLFIRAPWIRLQESGAIDELLLSLGYGADETALGSILTPQYRGRWGRDVALERMRAEYLRYTSGDNPIHEFFFWNRTRREISIFFPRFMPGVEILTPYLNPDVFDHLWRIPSALMECRSFHDAAIERAAPEYASIPYESKQSTDVDMGSYSRSITRGMAHRSAFWFGGEILDRRWIRPRLAASLLKPASAGTNVWWARWAIWLVSLEQLSAK